MTYAIDDAEFIRRRLEEIEAEKNLALTGTSIPEKEEVPSIESVYGDYAMGWVVNWDQPKQYEWSVDPIIK